MTSQCLLSFTRINHRMLSILFEFNSEGQKRRDLPFGAAKWNGPFPLYPLDEPLNYTLTKKYVSFSHHGPLQICLMN